MGASPAVKASLHLVLVEPEIPWNTGNAGRTALALDAELHLVGPLGFSLDDKQVRRAGLDYWERVKLRTWASWPEFAAQLPTIGEPYFFSARAATPYWSPRYPAHTVLVFGRESVGLPASVIDPARALRIPIADEGIRSLNLSTAVAVAAYEVARQRAPALG
jgi:tRNA (cytidine/uridine-2'-O-)-methyltransferase